VAPIWGILGRVNRHKRCTPSILQQTTGDNCVIPSGEEALPLSKPYQMGLLRPRQWAHAHAVLPGDPDRDTLRLICEDSLVAFA